MVLACAPKQPSNVFFSCELHTRECLDPFDHPECEALDVFVNEVLCVGKSTKLASFSLKFALLAAPFLLEHRLERSFRTIMLRCILVSLQLQDVHTHALKQLLMSSRVIHLGQLEQCPKVWMV
jgi:hypothetical protein